MHTQQFQVIFVIVLVNHISGLAFEEHNFQADVINNCTNSTCIHTYEQVYKSFTNSENSYNISYALYPGRLKASSVNVFVNLSGLGPNKTKTSTPAQYTWSMSCLYATIPSPVLEVLSLGAILVTPRTQYLNLQIPPFCCNVSEDKEERKRIIDEMLTRAIADLQDMAMSPGIRNPELNTAECVTQGHEPNIDNPGVSHYIRPILWCSFVSVMLLGPIIARFVLSFLGNGNGEGPLIFSATIIFIVFLVSDFGLIIFLIINPGLKNIPLEISIPVVCIVLEGIVLYLIQYCRFKCGICSEPKKRSCIFLLCINLLSYHLCWLIVGIMINPAWGLTVLFIACFVVVALLFSGGQICDSQNDSSPIYRFLMFFSALCGLSLVGALAVLAGQTFYGRETAEDVIKTGLLYIVGVISWIFKKEYSNPTSPTQTDQVTNNPSSSRSLLEQRDEVELNETN